MISAQIMKEIKRIELKAGYLASDLLSGEYISAFKGRGMEFDEVRKYLPGDDVRSIDWKVSARMGEPYLKVFKEERELTMLIALDVSSSLYYGSNEKAKYEFAAELAAVLAFLATKNNDKVGLILYSDEIELALAPGKGKAHIWNLIKQILTHKPRSKNTNTELALKSIMNLCKRRSMVFLISDFWDQGYEKLFKQVARKHDLSCFEIFDKSEKNLFEAGVVSLEDRESGLSMLVDSSSKSLKAKFLEAFDNKSEFIAGLSKKSGASFMSMDKEIAIGDQLNYFFKRKDTRRSS